MKGIERTHEKECKAHRHTIDFLTKKHVKNDGIVPQYYKRMTTKPSSPRSFLSSTGRKSEADKHE